MCTLVLLRRPTHAWPLILAANRDEMANRLWKGPGRWWDDRPEVIAGQDIVSKITGVKRDASDKPVEPVILKKVIIK